MKSPTYNNMMISDQIAQHASDRTFKRARVNNKSIVKVVTDRINHSTDFGTDDAENIYSPISY